jgi:phage repressor protein C with HTH and peptisase S24 domain
VISQSQEEIIPYCHLESSVTLVAPNRDDLAKAAELARSLGGAIDDFNSRAPNAQRIKISTSLGRILDNDPTRQRTVRARRERPTVDPGVFTVQRYAHLVGTTVGALLGEVPDVLTEGDRQRMLEFADWLRERAQRFERTTIASALDNVRQFPTNARRDGDFPLPPIPIEEWVFKDTDRPQPLHAGAKPVAADVAAGLPSNPDDDTLIPTAQVLNSILREIRDPRVNVIRIAGHSMHPVLRNGWLVLIDPARALFQAGKVVMVYIKDEGTTIGLLAKNGGGFKIVKRNQDYGGPTEILLREGEWYPVGTVTRIVDAPVEIE